MKKAKRLTLALIIMAAALAAAIAVLALAKKQELPYTGSRFVMSVYADIPAPDGLASLRDGSEPFEGASRALEREVRYKGYTEEERLARNAEGGL